jgi:hypothetical protein
LKNKFKDQDAVPLLAGAAITVPPKVRPKPQFDNRKALSESVAEQEKAKEAEMYKKVMIEQNKIEGINKPVSE